MDLNLVDGESKETKTFEIEEYVSLDY